MKYNLSKKGKLPDLIIFDVDGTLADRDSGQLLPGRREFFLALPASSHPKIALATNQGGVGFRHWLRFADPAPGWFLALDAEEMREKLAMYPTQNEAEIRFNDLVEAISRLARQRLAHYISFAYQFKSGGWADVPTDANGPGWSKDWRKPAPGMLRQAMADVGVSADQTLMVGDRDEDSGAATAAGCTFVSACEFFGETI